MPSKTKTKIEETKTESIQPKEVIQIGDMIYTIKQTNDESRDLYLLRVNYIIECLNNMNHDEKIDWDILIRNSYIWRNIKHKGMTYPSTFTKNIYGL